MILSFESALEALLDFAHPEAADGTARNRVVRRVEDPKDHVALSGGHDVAHGLYFVEVEGVVARDGAVEPGLEESRPLVAESARTTSIVLAYARHTAVHTLWRRED